MRLRGGGIITENSLEDASKLDQMVEKRAFAWRKSDITPSERSTKLGQNPVWLLITGMTDKGKFQLARAVEKTLFEAGKTPYFLGISNVMSGLDYGSYENREEHLRRLGELALSFFSGRTHFDFCGFRFR